MCWMALKRQLTKMSWPVCYAPFNFICLEDWTKTGEISIMVSTFK